jgi:hypothetical protein
MISGHNQYNIMNLISSIYQENLALKGGQN